MADVIDRIKGDNIRWVKFHVLDPEGYVKSVSFSSAVLSEQPLRKGFITRELAQAFGEEGALLLFPIEETYAILPWEERGARMLAYLGRPQGGGFPKDPYHAMKRALEGLEAVGYSIRVKQRLEFYVFDNITVDKDTRRPPAVGVDGRELPWNPTSRYVESYHSAAVPFDMYSIMREQMGDVLNLYFSTPVIRNGHGAGPGQQYLTIGVGEGMRAMFDAVNARFVVKMVAMLNGSLATFLPYPLKGEAPSGWELEVSLWKGKEEDEDAALYFVGGILEHIESLTLFTNPSPNSFKRLKVDPRYNVASPYASSAVQIREEENRSVITLTFPDGTANPYMAMGAVVGAGIDGIKKKAAPEVIEVNPKAMTSRERARAKIKELPTSLSEAIRALNSDNAYLKGIFSAELLALYLERKVRDERENSTSPTHYEWLKYGDL